MEFSHGICRPHEYGVLIMMLVQWMVPMVDNHACGVGLVFLFPCSSNLVGVVRRGVDEIRIVVGAVGMNASKDVDG